MAIVICCEKELNCTRFTNTCPECGADYNSCGQHLAPRSQWGAETGETEADILAIDALSTDQLLEGED